MKAAFYNEDMELMEIEGTQLLARAICHELDHLEGHLYVEKVEDELVTVTEDGEADETAE